MKKIINVMFLVILICISIPLFSKGKEPAMAGVAVIKYQNNTGSADYEWITNTLPDAVFSSMKEVFEFNRTDPAVIDTALVSFKKNEFIPNAVNMGAIAKSTLSDIVISGIYTYNKETDLIEITTYIYHVSRNAITTQIKTESPVSNEMFNIVDHVALTIVEHIQLIAEEDYKKQGQKIADEKLKEEGKPAKQQKIVLIKVPDRYDYSNLYFNISNSMIFMLGPLAQTLPIGLDLKLNFTNSYRDIFIYGGTLSIAMIFPANDKTEFTGAGITIIDFKAMLGLNFNIKHQVFIQPYIGLGGAFQIFSLKTIEFTGSNPPYNTITQYHLLGDFSTSAGIRVPVRLAGKNMFITPFMEFCVFPVHKNFVGFIQAGVGISL